MNATCVEAREHLYVDFPALFTWNKNKKKWKKRQVQQHGAPQIGRLYLTHPGRQLTRE